jgi:predicted nucleotidyltransferase
MTVRPDAVDRLAERLAEVCRGDPRIAAAFLSGSHARGDADEHSDVDLIVVPFDQAADELRRERPDLIRRLGRPLFLEDFGSETTSFFILADGTEAELSVAPVAELAEVHVGPFVPIHDPDGHLAGLAFPTEEADPGTQRAELERALRWFWHELSHFVTAVGRGHRWWAIGQLEALRRHVVNLVRIDGGLEASEEPYEKLDQMLDVGTLDGLAGTFVGLEPRALVAAGRTLATEFRRRGSALADRFGVEYPSELDRVLTLRLDEL